MTRRQRKSTYSLIVAIMSLFIWLGTEYGWFAGATASLEQNQPGMYRVTRFSDGDTIVVDMNGTNEQIRFIGVDTPETHDPRKPVQCYGAAASAFTKRAIGFGRVRLEADTKSTNRDRYDRLLRYVYLQDGTLLNQELIRQGYGFYYPYFPFDKSDDFAAAQQEAQDAGRGLWKNCEPIPTDNGGWNSNPA